MAVDALFETSFRKGATLDMRETSSMLLTKGKCMACFYKSKDDHFMRECRIPHNFFSNDFFCTVF